MDGNMLDGLQYPILAGAGAIAGIIIMIPFAIASIWLPALSGWLWAPPVLGTIAGLVSAIWAK